MAIVIECAGLCVCRFLAPCRMAGLLGRLAGHSCVSHRESQMIVGPSQACGQQAHASLVGQFRWRISRGEGRSFQHSTLSSISSSRERGARLAPCAAVKETEAEVVSQKLILEVAEKAAKAGKEVRRP